MQQQPRPSLPLWFLIANWLLILAAFALGAYLGDRRLHRLPEPQRSTLAIVFDEVLKSHIEPPDEHELLERAISGMVDGLDAYSRYIPPREVPRYEETTSGTYQGIGAKIVTHGEQVVVHFPFPGGPAAKAGLLPGDRVLAVDGNALDDADTRAHVVELVRGEQGTPVRLRIRRGDEEREIEVRRGSVLRPCVKWGRYVDPARGLGYLHLTGFHPTAAREVTAA
ncbi:MAG TPA: PDZ domain-containing protein, partial [bacterium]|nr:PDZ domain-containing protein [bacterium]